MLVSISSIRQWIDSAISSFFLSLQAVINANIIAPLVHLLQNAEFDIKKEAAWAISNATSGGSHEQIKYAIFCTLVSINADSRCQFHGLFFLVTGT